MLFFAKPPGRFRERKVWQCREHTVWQIAELASLYRPQHAGSFGGTLRYDGVADCVKTDVAKRVLCCRYGKYFKMLKVGVPRAAAAGKMASEGLDPHVLDMDPNDEAPPGGDEPEEPAPSESDKSEDEYSD